MQQDECISDILVVNVFKRKHTLHLYFFSIDHKEKINHYLKFPPQDLALALEIPCRASKDFVKRSSCETFCGIGKRKTAYIENSANLCKGMFTGYYYYYISKYVNKTHPTISKYRKWSISS